MHSDPTYRLSASQYHRALGSLLSSPSSGFAGYKIQQECPVVRLLPTYPDSSHHFDWVILDLRVVIEVHGQQHYSQVSFGKGCDPSLVAIRGRDRRKMDAAVAAGFTYLEIPWYTIRDLTAEKLWQMIRENLNANPIIVKKKDTKQREYRKAQYQRMKEWRGKISSSRHQEDDSETSDSPLE